MTSTGSIERDAYLKRYRTYIQSSGMKYATFDLERSYTEMSTKDMIDQRDKTVADLERHPDFGTKFYTEHVEYLNRKLEERKTFRDWIWRNTVLKLDLAIWRLGVWLKERKNA